MRTIRIDGKFQMCFILKETDESIVYIPVKSLNRVDYERLLDIEEKGGEMLTEMRKTKLANGRNALALYDNIIQVVRMSDKTNGSRLRKPDEPQAIGHDPAAPVQQPQAQAQPVTEQKQEEPKKRGRGRPPKSASTQQE